MTDFETEEMQNAFWALLEYDRRCPKCYRYMDGGNCGKCETYYGDCDCTPMTPNEIRDDEE